MKRRLLSIVMILFLFPLTVNAMTPDEKGYALAAEHKRVDTGWLDISADAHMTLKNKQGQEAERKFHFKIMEIVNDGNKMLVVFDSPRDIKGTALSTFSHKDRNDDQWLFLPELKRVKRISSENRSGSFVGTEFAYEDITSEELERYTYKYLRDEVQAGKDCYVVERFPVDKENTGYTRAILWFDKATYLTLKMDFYDRKNVLLKTLLLKDYHEYLGIFYRPHLEIMTNHQTGKSTHLAWSNFKWRNGVKDNEFDKNSLKRAR